MTVGSIRKILLGKCRQQEPDPDWSLVEYLPNLYMERYLEEHEFLLENLLNWKVGSENKILLTRRPRRHDLFKEPEKYLLLPHTTILPNTRQTLLQDFFKASNETVPQVEGPLWLKSEGKKNWKKYFFVLKSSGLYYLPKGKKSSKEPVCLVSFDVSQVYTAVGWKKKFKSPTDFGFAIKHPQIQEKNPKHIRYLCAETEMVLLQWLTGIRIIKHGGRLFDNYQSLTADNKTEAGNPTQDGQTVAVPKAAKHAETAVNDAIYSPASESKSFDSGVSSMSEVGYTILYNE